MSNKAVFGKEETRNLLGMLKSSDTENQTIAFEALKNADLKNYFGELLVLYKHAKVSVETWEKQCPEAWKVIKTYINGEPSSLTSGKCLSLMTEHKASKASLELYLEYFVGDMITFLDQLGYPANKFNINIELKE